MRFGVEFVPYLRLDTMVALAKEVEQLGFQQIWVCDHYHNRYVHSVLAQLALNTHRVQLGPGVTNPYLTHPAVTAAAVATLNEISKGRALLGMSSGDPFFLETVGVEQTKPVTSVREAIHIIRGLLAGEKVDFEGECFTCRGARLRFKPGNHIPIYIGGRRQRMLRLAGEVADGALINASHPVDIEDSVKSIKEGMIQGGRAHAAFDFVAYLAVSIDSDGKRARDAARGVVAFVASSAPEKSLAHRAISAEDVEVVRRYLRRGDLARAREAVTDEMLDEFSVCGGVEVLADRVEELARIGVTTIVIGSPIGPEPLKSLKLIAKEISDLSG
ncbi:MAG: 5,10-methylenetetrahydromethanopterin reductase [Candidatus Hadarchaeum sp.]|uniref:5,10-methylenetetrahydromethanopterin reductase n=1 Tax=Candidatus Hadarchaeum sp. TaxID=2883567 RepID=UPI003D11F9CF